jgi:spore germination protein YaaH
MSDRIFCWVGHLFNERSRLALEHYGDQITDVSIFGWRVDASGNLTETFDADQLDPYRAKWPHIKFWLAFRNDGAASVFTALRNNAAARAKLIEGLGKALDKRPWLTGIDIDLEAGGGIANAPAAENLFRQIANYAHARGLECSAALPPLTIDGSVGGQDWARYSVLGEFLDQVAIMSYDFAWMGSAPGPISPGYWMRAVYSWAVSQIDPAKVLMGLPLYAYFWRIDTYPANLGWNFRGDSGTYYAAWQHFSGVRAQDGSDTNPAGSGSHHRIGWLAFRDDDSKSAWGFTDVYDWRDAYYWDRGTPRMTRDLFEAKPYMVRYGLPSALDQGGMWGVTDNSSTTEGGTYRLNARSVRDVNGRYVSPKSGFTMTLELLKRYPVAATIMDDNAGNAQQLSNYYNGDWEQWSNEGRSYHQYRGTGDLSLAHTFTGSVYLQIRGQFATAGWIGVTARGYTVEVNNTGTLRVRQGSTVLGSASVPARTVGDDAGESRFVLAIRLRENSVRAYWAANENTAPTRYLKVNATPSGGTVGITATATAWIDHVYVGDGWWYQPREAVTVKIGGRQKTLGRFERDGITWDSHGRFRPLDDIDEEQTREGETRSISLDWVYDHWQGVPIYPDTPVDVQVIATDHDVWVGRVICLDKAGSFIAYWSDAETIVHWRDRARLDYKLAGIALWSLGQEDVRIWPRLRGGELTAETKRLDR